MALQRVLWTHPDRFKLLGFVGHRNLAFRHARHQKRHVKAARQVAVGDPVGQHEHLIGGQCQAAGLALGGKRGFSVDLGNVSVVSPAPLGMAGEQNAQLLKALADGGNRLGQVQVALFGAALRHAVGLSIGGVNAPAREHVGAGCKAGRHGASGHQDFEPARAVAQKQHGGCGAQGGGFALWVKELGCACHAPLSGGLNFIQG